MTNVDKEKRNVNSTIILMKFKLCPPVCSFPVNLVRLILYYKIVTRFINSICHLMYYLTSSLNLQPNRKETKLSSKYCAQQSIQDDNFRIAWSSTLNAVGKYSIISNQALDIFISNHFFQSQHSPFPQSP